MEYLNYINLRLFFVFIFAARAVHTVQSNPSSCMVQDGTCTYNINLAPAGTCSSKESTDHIVISEPRVESLNYASDERMTQMQLDLTLIKSDHEQRIKELELSIQKVLRNSLPAVPVSNYETIPQARDPGRHVTSHEQTIPEVSDNILMLQLQGQFNRMRMSLSQKSADLLETRNKLNETIDLMSAAQRQALDSSTKLVEMETQATVLERETSILKNKLKHKTEQYEYTAEKLNITETKLYSTENQLYDVVRSEATLKEELETLKVILNRTQKELATLKAEHEELQSLFKKTTRRLERREEELMECFTGREPFNLFTGLSSLVDLNVVKRGIHQCVYFLYFISSRSIKTQVSSF